MRILQGAAFMALLIGAGGIMDPAGKIQPAAVALVGIALIGLLATWRKTWMEDLSKAWEQAWSLESIDAHEAAGRSMEYIGSREKGNRIYDFFLDNAGYYWYRVRIRLTDGRTVTEEEDVFGHRVKYLGKRREHVL